MMDDYERENLQELRAQVTCDKKFACINSALSDLCKGKYHTELDILECLELAEPKCRFSRAFGCTNVCTCPLRRQIAKNIDRWGADDIRILQ